MHAHAVSAILHLVTSAPRPIVDWHNKIVLLWSAKAGCTFAIKWIFQHMGVLQAALAYDPWIHCYRKEVFHGSEQYQQAVEEFSRCPSSYRMVKFVRSPFKRAVSSYIHVLRNLRTRSGLVESCAGPGQRPSFSFDQFVRYLGTLDLRHSNIHYRLQTHPLERQFPVASMFLVNLDDSMESLPKLENYLGLPQTEQQQYRESPHHVTQSKVDAAQFSGDQLFEFSSTEAPVVPDYGSFYNSELERCVYDLYAEDFLRYGFARIINSNPD